MIRLPPSPLGRFHAAVAGNDLLGIVHQDRSSRTGVYLVFQDFGKCILIA